MRDDAAKNAKLLTQLMARGLALICVVVFVAIVAAKPADYACPDQSSYTSCLQQVNADGCCRCATPSSGWAAAGCDAGSYNGNCIVSCGDGCSNELATVNCDAPCTMRTCSCGAFTLDSVAVSLDSQTGQNIYKANWRICNLCNDAVDDVYISGSTGFGSSQAALFDVFADTLGDATEYGWRQVTEDPAGATISGGGAIRFTRLSGATSKGKCVILTVASTSAALHQPTFGWRVNMYMSGGVTEKTETCTGGQTTTGNMVESGCLGTAALSFKTCCDGSVIQSDGTCPGPLGENCKVCRGGCFDGGFTTVGTSENCPTCKTCCDDSQVTTDDTCPTCCFNEAGAFVAFSDPSLCWSKCCTNGALRQGQFNDVCAGESCVECCDGGVYDASAGTDQCDCCENEAGELRNVAFVGGSSVGGGDVGGSFCYYCKDLCAAGATQEECVASGDAVTVKFIVSTLPNGDIKIRAVYSTNFVDNHWGPVGVSDWGWEAERKWSQVLGSDKILVQMMNQRGDAVMDFNVDLIAGYGPSIADEYPSGYKSSCVDFKPAGVIKADGKLVLGDADWFVGCTTATEVDCNSECGLSIDACVEGNSSPTREMREGDGPCGGDGWSDEVWYEWIVKSGPFSAGGGGGFGYPVIYNIHASPSKPLSIGDNCLVQGEIPSPCDTLGVSDDSGECWEECPCEGVRRLVTDDAPCVECCCDDLPPPAGGTCADRQCCCGAQVVDFGVCQVCCPANSLNQQFAATAGECPKKCCDDTWVASGVTCPACCPGTKQVCSDCIGECEQPVACCDGSLVPAGQEATCPVCCCDASTAATEAECPVCCCAEAQAAPCYAATQNSNGECMCLDAETVFPCTSVSCCVGEAATAAQCPFCCPDDAGYYCAEDVDAPAGTKPTPSADVSGCATTNGIFDGTPSAMTLDRKVEGCQPDELPTYYECCDGSSTTDSTLAACPECPAPCCDGQTIALAADCPSCTVVTKVCPGTNDVILISAECPVLCCDDQYYPVGTCPVCCPETDEVIFGITQAECPVLCCDGSSAASQADCPYCCPGLAGAVFEQSKCATPGACDPAQDCVDCPLVTVAGDLTCSFPSCQPCGPQCECTCRSPAYPFCCPDGGGLYSPCTDATVEGAIGVGEDFQTEDGCALDCACNYVDESCLVVDEDTPPAGCSGSPDCESCRAATAPSTGLACEWCEALGRCTSSCADGADILCGADVVEVSQPSCYKDCYGNGDCVDNDAATCTSLTTTDCEAGTCNPDDPTSECVKELCVCYDFGYINKDNAFCAPKAASNDADKVGIIVGSAGAAGIVLLLCIAAAMVVIGGKAAYDFATAGDNSVGVLCENPGYVPPPNSHVSPICE